MARIRAALLALDMGDKAGAISRAAPLDEAGNPWRHEAREVLGVAAYASGDLQKARDYFTEIQQDAQTPADIWQRAIAMISLIDGQIAPAASPSEHLRNRYAGLRGAHVRYLGPPRRRRPIFRHPETPHPALRAPKPPPPMRAAATRPAPAAPADGASGANGNASQEMMSAPDGEAPSDAPPQTTGQ